MTKEQEKQLNDHFNSIDESGNNIKQENDITPRALIFSILDKIERIESELDRKDRTSKKELRILIKDARRELFEALKRIKGAA